MVLSLHDREPSIVMGAQADRQSKHRRINVDEYSLGRRTRETYEKDIPASIRDVRSCDFVGRRQWRALSKRTSSGHRQARVVGIDVVNVGDALAVSAIERK